MPPDLILESRRASFRVDSRRLHSLGKNFWSASVYWGYVVPAETARGLQMGHVVRDTDWCVIDIDTATGQILFRQRWRYNWIAPPGQPAWTQSQRERFHRRSDVMIWRIWSNRVTFNVAGSSEFARRFSGRAMPINLDAQWVLSNQHWAVFVTKVPRGFMGHPSRIEWNLRQIHLSTEDFETSRHAGGIVAHEFGHSAGNTGVLGRGDEYRPTSPHHADTGSVLNTGRALRERHFRTIIEEMNRMIPDTTFSVGSVG